MYLYIYIRIYREHPILAALLSNIASRFRCEPAPNYLGPPHTASLSGVAKLLLDASLTAALLPIAANPYSFKCF